LGGGYRVVGKRLYRDGSEELVTVPTAGDTMFIKAESGSEAKLLDLLSRGVRSGEEIERLGYKIAVACLMKRIFVRRGYCRDCFFKPHCALWRNPKWFMSKKNLAQRAREVASLNHELRKILESL